ncbi:hypothetical protein [Streptomyces odontomachi]|uniref:hypothetical protein n=1 Tax=Streptomyces odontomachi TaxID=2944940 RepID=UPI002108DD99|nr:hypothetical protein [Streptomyces sp. ODS25]
MLSRKKFAAVTGLLGGLALTCAGIAHAYGETSNGCTRDDQGNVTCVHVEKSDTVYQSKDGTTHVHQSKSCETTSTNRVVRPQGSPGQQEGVTRVGAQVDCSNSVSAPKGFQPPHISLP